MADPRFFANAGPFALGELARRCGAELGTESHAAKRITDVAPLDTAGADHISFLDNRKYIDAFVASRAGACIVSAALAPRAPADMALLIAPDPYRAYAKVARVFYPLPPPEPGVSPRAVVAPEATLGEGCRVEPGVVIEAGAEIGMRCHIGPNAVIGVGVVIGDDCFVGANASVSHALIG